MQSEAHAPEDQSWVHEWVEWEKTQWNDAEAPSPCLELS